MLHISRLHPIPLISLSLSVFFVIRAIKFRRIGGISSFSRLVGAKKNPPSLPCPPSGWIGELLTAEVISRSLSSGSCLFDYLSLFPEPISLAFFLCGLFDHANGNQYDASIHRRHRRRIGGSGGWVSALSDWCGGETIFISWKIIIIMPPNKTNR